ncbi:MAG: putative Ig domain-containing protein, partial [Parahaliea sp.]
LEAQEGTRVAAVLQAIGGEGDYLWSMESNGGTNLRLLDDGALSGTAPGSAGSYAVTVSVTDDNLSVTKVVILNVTQAAVANDNYTPVSVTTTSLMAATPHAHYAAALSAKDGSGSYTWTMLDDGDTGLTLSSAGILSGTAPGPGSYGVAVRVSDSNQRSNAQATLTLNVSSTDDLTIATRTILPTMTSINYSQALAASGGNGDYVWMLVTTSPALADISVSPAGALSYDASAAAPADGDYEITVNVSDSDSNSANKTLQLTVDFP